MKCRNPRSRGNNLQYCSSNYKHHGHKIIRYNHKTILFGPSLQLSINDVLYTVKTELGDLWSCAKLKKIFFFQFLLDNSLPHNQNLGQLLKVKRKKPEELIPLCGSRVGIDMLLGLPAISPVDWC